MFVSAWEQPGNRHHDRTNHLVFILLNSEAHGINRVRPEPYTCECGIDLTPERLDEGDESKSSWPNCKSWREGGKEKCPICDEYPSIGREQRIRARGYEPTPKDDIKGVTPAQRSEAIERQNGRCLLCDSEAEYVVRMVPPRYGGTRDLVNLAGLCDHHYSDYGHMFADILFPVEWYKVEIASWEDVAGELRDQFAEAGREQLAEELDRLLQKGKPENPFPYLR